MNGSDDRIDAERLIINDADTRVIISGVELAALLKRLGIVSVPHRKRVARRPSRRRRRRTG
ncbi:MAG: hypothetical protein E6J87_02140 [Deltaproteobacteria bacterium]|nr:MAG: hypothetical protein E6J87_02140 [Deltaproteobacteria bacterium]